MWNRDWLCFLLSTDTSRLQPHGGSVVVVFLFVSLWKQKPCECWLDVKWKLFLNSTCGINQVNYDDKKKCNWNEILQQDTDHVWKFGCFPSCRADMICWSILYNLFSLNYCSWWEYCLTRLHVDLNDQTLTLHHPFSKIKKCEQIS